MVASKFTILTVCYNSSKTIERTILSVKNQTCSDYEYIFIDGASTDNTIEIIESHLPEFAGKAKLISGPDSGIYNAMNKGIRLAKGEYIGIINSDDWYETNALELVAQSTISQADVIYGILKIWDGGKPSRLYSIYPQYLGAECIPHPTCFVKRSAYDKYGLFDESYQSSADLDLLLRFRNNGAEFRVIENVLAHFTTGGVCFSKSSELETISILKKHGLLTAFQAQVKKFKRNIRKFRSEPAI
ncbi:MAG: glycosyltransferase [Chitinispirillaceae bacterium]|nr:glycosyltransferase [Chitinispirillaceae bacterium]